MMRYNSAFLWGFLLGLTLFCFTAAAPVQEDSIEEVLQQTLDNGDAKAGTAAWSKYAHRGPFSSADHGRSWTPRGVDWQRQETHQKAEMTHQAKEEVLPL